MTSSVRVKALFDLPAEVRKGDFVLKLTEGITRAAETAETYVVTPALADSLDRALRLVGSALKDGRSQAAYLHGSFGSGKSHFMALLSLLVSGHEEAWRKPELHDLRAKHPFLAQGKLLQLHLHMLAHDSIEAAIFGRFLAYLEAHHPEAPIPPLFADERLFEDARRMLRELGEEAFFRPMNADLPAIEGWGDVAEAARWDQARFEQASGSTDSKQRAELFDALVRTRFTAYPKESRSFVSLDAGLAILAASAAGLGYRGVVIFLDELILWLAANSSDRPWVNMTVQKMVKLVEAQDMHREIPVVSFMARQRDLAEMVGEDYAGAENALLRETLKHFEGRYGDIRLEDRNLPAIVERRVLVPRDAEARRTLDEAFGRMKSAAGPAFATLLAEGDAEAFRKLYPFSPALVDSLVALSNSLQRERTAIKLLMELLVEHADDLLLGEVVCVGDLFDALAGGEDTADGVMKSRFESAKQLYKYQLLPLIQDRNGTTTAEKCQRLRPEHPTRLGCSNCPQRACRTDNRLVKTLVMAALVPEVTALKAMTASKLARLNHGSLRVPIPGTEANLVAQKLREWAAAVGQIQVDGEGDPSVRLVIEGVNVGPILDQARSFDTAGARQRVLRDLLFEAMGEDKVLETDKELAIDWRGTRRIGNLVFGNVRKMGAAKLQCREQHDWRLVVDYPFDEPGFGPTHDLDTIREAKEQGGGTWTLVWLPSFFSTSMNRLLGELTVLDHILESKETTRRYVGSLSVENQSRALLDLDNLRISKRARLLQAIEQAYGLASPRGDDLDPSNSLPQHLYVLKAGADLAPRLPPRLTDAKQTYIEALLEARYPRHPKLERRITPKLADELLELFGELVDDENRRLERDKDIIARVRGTLGELGLVRVTETAVFLQEDRTLQTIEKRRVQQSEEHPLVSEVRRWIDDTGRMGLTHEVMDLVVRAYARYTARTLVRFDRLFEAKAGQEIPDDVRLEKPELPSAADWNLALNLAGACFGITFPKKALHADNLQRFEKALADRLKATATGVLRLPGLLQHWASNLQVGAEPDRLKTALSAAALVGALQGKSSVAQVETLARYVPVTSAKAVGASIAQADPAARILEDSLVAGAISQIQAREDDLLGAAELIEEARLVLRQDEIIQPLVEKLRGLAVRGQRLLEEVLPPVCFVDLSLKGVKPGDLLTKIDGLMKQMKDELAKITPGASVDLQLTLRQRNKK